MLHATEQNRSMKVLVTGGSGFIGTNLVTDLLENGTKVLNFDINPPLNPAHHGCWERGDILDANALSDAFARFQPTHLVHLAARTDTVGTHRIEDYRTNTEGTANVLEAIAATPSVAHSIITSTQFVCEPGYDPKHDEDFAPHTVYGESKAISEQLTRRSGIGGRWTIIRPTTIWGPWLLRHERQFFRVLRSGLYVHPGHQPCMRSWGYVGNVSYQIRQLFAASSERVHRKVFYVGDPPLNLLDWVNGFSYRLKGRGVRVVPRPVVKGLGRIGDLLELAGLRFPITTSRYHSMTQQYLAPMEPTLALVGELPFTLDSGIDATIDWLSARHA